MYDDDDDDDGKGTDDDVNRTPFAAFARKNHQQPDPESYRSSPQKHQAYHGYTGKAMNRPGFNKSIAYSAMQRHRK